MTTELMNVDMVASALLSICVPHSTLKADRPIRFLSLDSRHPERDLMGILMRERESEELLQTECEEIIARAKLTPRQNMVLRLRLSGESFESIGHRRGQSRQAAQCVFLAAIKKLARSYHVYPYSGLADVYRAETRRRF